MRLEEKMKAQFFNDETSEEIECKENFVSYF